MTHVSKIWWLSRRFESHPNHQPKLWREGAVPMSWRLWRKPRLRWPEPSWDGGCTRFQIGTVNIGYVYIYIYMYAYICIYIIIYIGKYPIFHTRYLYLYLSRWIFAYCGHKNSQGFLYISPMYEIHRLWFLLNPQRWDIFWCFIVWKLTLKTLGLPLFFKPMFNSMFRLTTKMKVN